jgi:acyl carrier protein
MSLRADLGIDSVGLMSIVFLLDEQAGVDAFSHVQAFISAEYVSDIITIVRQG